MITSTIHSKILHYDLLKNEFNVMRTLADLHGILREKLTNYFYGFMVKCEKLHIFENDGFGYTYGSAHDSLQDRAFSFPEHACVMILHDQLSDTCEHARMEDALSALLREHDQEILKNSLVALTTLGICQYKDMVTTSGPNNFAENERWLTHEFLDDLLRVEDGDEDETDGVSHRCCDSCKREQVEATDDIYALKLRTVDASDVRLRGKFKPGHIRTHRNQNKMKYCLCSACNGYLVEKEDEPENIWPLFFHHLLFGTHTPTFANAQCHHDVCGGRTLWRLVPRKMRPWWTRELGTRAAYRSCTIQDPEPVFEDKTLDLQQFNRDYDSEQLCRLTRAMENYSVIMNNVMCPWKCSTSCHESGRIAFDIMIQRMLPKVVLKLYSSTTHCRKVHFSSNCYFRVDDQYPTILLNDNWKVKPAVVIEEGCLKIITCKAHHGGRDKLVLFAPESPHGHVLNAEMADQLAPYIAKHQASKK